MSRDSRIKTVAIPEDVRLPLRIVMAYVIFGGVWILFSDQLLGYLVKDAALFLEISVIKGWFYVLVTGLLLFQLIRSGFLRVQNLNRNLNEINGELEGSNVEIRALYEEVAASEETLQASYDELQAYRERIEYYAFHDPSTGFYNRDFMLEGLSKLMKGSDSPAEPLIFLVAGIQGMERLVNVYGTNISEIIHYQVGMSILEAIGQIDSIAMLGSGRFGIILDRQPEAQNLLSHIEAIDSLVRVPIRINQLTVSVQMAYGATRCVGGVYEPEVLVQQAETAFHHAVDKRSREHLVWYEPALQEEKSYLGKVEFLLRHAFEAGEFSMVYQPQVVDSSEAGIQGYEALIRWNNAELGNIYPDVFIPIAEATGQIDGIGEFVIANVCRFLRDFMDQSGTQTKVSINASLMELMNPDYIHRLTKNLLAFDLKPEHVSIEITETALAKYLDSVIENLRILRDMGFEIHLDDFGTGYSSLNHLGRLPVHALKIDRSFVWQMETDPRMKQMTKMIIKVGHQLELKIIAEGVETEAQYLMLKGMGCDSFQGYFFSKPITEEELLKKTPQRIDMFA